MARVMRLRASGAIFFSQRVRGITPNIAPPSSITCPAQMMWNSMSPSFIWPPTAVLRNRKDEPTKLAGEGGKFKLPFALFNRTYINVWM